MKDAEMNVAFSLMFSRTEFDAKQPNAMIMLKTGSAIYAPIITNKGSMEECKKELINIIELLFTEYEDKQSGIATAQPDK